MQVKLYNTLTKTKEEFKPIDNKEVKIYTCGQLCTAMPT